MYRSGKLFPERVLNDRMRSFVVVREQFEPEES